MLSNSRVTDSRLLQHYNHVRARVSVLAMCSLCHLLAAGVETHLLDDLLITTLSYHPEFRDSVILVNISDFVFFFGQQKLKHTWHNSLSLKTNLRGSNQMSGRGAQKMS